MSTRGPEDLPIGLGRSSGPADSAGVPWEGRSLPTGDFAGDDGEADPALTRVLRRGDDRSVVRRLAASRVFVPVTAVAAETTTSESGVVSDKEADMAVVLLHNPDGRKALPIFSSIADLTAFDATLRPVAVQTPRAAQAAISEQADLMVLDCASEQAFEVRGSMVWSLARGHEWFPAHEDPVVRAAVERVCARYSEISEVTVAAGVPDGQGVLQVTLTLAAGFDRVGIERLVTTVAEELAQEDDVRARIDGLGFTVT